MAGLPSPTEARSWRLYAFSEPMLSRALALASTALLRTRTCASTASGTSPAANPHYLSGLFHPDDAHELPPSGLCTFERSGARLRVPSSRAVFTVDSATAPAPEVCSLSKRVLYGAVAGLPRSPSPLGVPPLRHSFPLA